MTMIFWCSSSIAVVKRSRVQAYLQKLILMSLVVYLASSLVSINVAHADELLSQVSEELPFDEFDISTGQKRVAQALGGMRRKCEKESQENLPDFSVKGPPNSRAGSGFMSAEVGQEFSFLNISAGVLADRNSISDGLSGYTSKLSMDFQKESVVGGLNLKTRMRNSKKHSTVGIEFGPHLARRFGNGVEVFFKGSAEAVSRYEHDGEMVPTGGPLQRPEQVGVSGTVGLAR